jgi:hypothetical protein
VPGPAEEGAHYSNRFRLARLDPGRVRGIQIRRDSGGPAQDNGVGERGIYSNLTLLRAICFRLVDSPDVPLPSAQTQQWPASDRPSL